MQFFLVGSANYPVARQIDIKPIVDNIITLANLMRFLRDIAALSRAAQKRVEREVVH